MRKKGISFFGTGCHWTIYMPESLFVPLVSVCCLCLASCLFFRLGLMIEGEHWNCVVWQSFAFVTALVVAVLCGLSDVCTPVVS